jgi:hypothetical protein
MIVSTVRIPYKSYGQTVQIVSLSDLHEGHINQESDALRKTLARKDCYFIFNGDNWDSIVIPDRRYHKSMDTTEGDAILDEGYNRLLAKLWPVRDRILWMHRGNHEDVVVRRCGTDLAGRLCKELGVLYAGYSSLIGVQLYKKGGGTRTVDFRCHHGWGGGCRTIGSVITKYSHDTKYWDADIYIYGHDHAMHAVPIPRGTRSGKKLIAKDQHIILSGTYLRTYTDTTDASWHETKGFPLTQIGSPTINIKPDAHKWVKIWVDT